MEARKKMYGVVVTWLFLLLIKSSVSCAQTMSGKTYALKIATFNIYKGHNEQTLSILERF